MDIYALVMLKNGSIVGMEPILGKDLVETKTMAVTRIAEVLYCGKHMIDERIDHDDESNLIAVYDSDEDVKLQWQLWWTGLECTKPTSLLNRT